LFVSLLLLYTDVSNVNIVHHKVDVNWTDSEPYKDVTCDNTNVNFIFQRPVPG